MIIDLAAAAIGLERRNLLPATIACLRRALTQAPDDPALWRRLGHALWRDRQYEDAEQAVERAIVLDPENFSSRHVLGSIYADQGRLGHAIAAYNDALALAPENAAVKLDRALTFLLSGNLRTGFREYEARIEHLAALYPKMPMPRWSGQDAMGKTILVVAEQGIGDIIMFSRYLPWLAARCNGLIFNGPAELACLFDRWPQHVIPWYMTTRTTEPIADFYVPLGSLPMIHNTSIDTIPGDPGFLRERPFKIDLPSSGDLKVGIYWAGNPSHGRDRDRSIALERFLPLAALPNVQLYSFQVGHRAGDIEIVGAQTLIHDLSPRLTDWSKTLEMLQSMDVVVTVDSAIAHIASAIGRKTFILVQKSPDWRWGISGETTPWYPTARLFRQETIGDWRDVFVRIERAIVSHRSIAQALPT